MTQEDIDDVRVKAIYKIYKDALKRLKVEGIPNIQAEAYINIYENLQKMRKRSAENYHKLDIEITRKAILEGRGI